MPFARCRVSQSSLRRVVSLNPDQQYYNDDGKQINGPCPRIGLDCEYVHPSDAGWERARVVGASSGRVSTQTLSMNHPALVDNCRN